MGGDREKARKAQAKRQMEVKDPTGFRWVRSRYCHTPDGGPYRTNWRLKGRSATQVPQWARRER